MPKRLTDFPPEERGEHLQTMKETIAESMAMAYVLVNPRAREVERLLGELHAQILQTSLNELRTGFIALYMLALWKNPELHGEFSNLLKKLPISERMHEQIITFYTEGMLDLKLCSSSSQV